MDQADRSAEAMRDMLERLITAADDEMVSNLDPGSPAWTAYFTVTQ